jgi:hypothetical protein
VSVRDVAPDLANPIEANPSPKRCNSSSYERIIRVSNQPEYERRRPGEPPPSWTATVGTTTPPAKAPPRSPAPQGEAIPVVRVEVAKVEGPGVCCILSTSKKGELTLGRIFIQATGRSRARHASMLLNRSQVAELQAALVLLDAALAAQGCKSGETTFKDERRAIIPILSPKAEVPVLVHPGLRSRGKDGVGHTREGDDVAASSRTPSPCGPTGEAPSDE